MKKLKLGLVGFGHINREVARQAVASGRAEIAWILDRSFRNPQYAEQVGDERQRNKEAAYVSLGYEPKIFNRLEELTQADKVDAMLEATGVDVIDCVHHKRKLWGDEVLFVTANKCMVAHHLNEFFGPGRCRDVRIEAAVAAGLPLIRSLAEHIAADQVKGLVGILNGTTNFILGRMEQDHSLNYEAALNEAVLKGYAEPGGEGDVDGKDAAYKLSILTRIAYQTQVDPSQLGSLVRGIADDANSQKVVSSNQG